MPDYLVGGVEFRRFGAESDPPSALQLGILRSSVQMIPVEHLTGLSRIEARRPGQVPTTGGGHNAADKVIRLSAASFSARHNARVNQTFFHEMGHIVDTNFGCLSEIRRFANQRTHALYADSNALLATPVNATLRATHGAGEVIADCYQILFRFLRDSSPYRNSVITTEYTGREAQRRFRVLLATSAFRFFTLEQLTAATDEQSFDRLISSLSR